MWEVRATTDVESDVVMDLRSSHELTIWDCPVGVIGVVRFVI